MTLKGARTSAVVALLVIVAGLAIAACGSSSSSSKATADTGSGANSGTSTGTSATGAGGHAGGFFTSLTSTQKACLKSHGVTLPTGRGRFAGGRGGQSGTGTFTRPAGTPPGGGAPGGTSTTGGYPGGAAGGGHGFGGGGFAASGKYATAFKDCDITVPTGHFGAGRAGGAMKPTAAALKSFVSCVNKNGYDLKSSEVNADGKGSILPKSLETNQTFLSAARSCEKDLFTGMAAGGGSGTPPGAGGAGASS